MVIFEKARDRIRDCILQEKNDRSRYQYYRYKYYARRESKPVNGDEKQLRMVTTRSQKSVKRNVDVQKEGRGAEMQMVDVHGLRS